MKELRETPLKGHQKFVEFYDIRAAAKALSAMNGKEICGKQVVIEFSRPGGHCKKINRFSSMTTKACSSPPYLSRPRPRPRPPLCGKTCAEDRSRGYGNTPRCYKISRGHNSTNNNKRWSLNSGSGGGNGIQTSMACLSLSGSQEEANSSRVPKENSKKDSQSSTANTKQQQQQQQRKSCGNMRKGWRQTGKDYDPRFLIKEDAIVESDSTDSRTTLMIKNIPNKYRFFLIFFYCQFDPIYLFCYFSFLKKKKEEVVK